MSSRETAASLARNLTRLCKREESIASVCRATGINRQQFNRYLAGTSIPNAENMKKICRHFSVSRTELFVGIGHVDLAAPIDLSRPPLRGSPWSHEDANEVFRRVYSDVRPSIGPGFYYVNFAEFGERKSVLRSTLVVRNDRGLTTFRRLTGLSERRASWWGQFRGDHRGVIVERAHWLYFVGMNFRGVGEPSMMVLRWMSGADPMLSGFALVNAAGGPSPIAVVVSPCAPRTSLKRALKNSHVYSVEDEAFDPLVLEALEEGASLLASKTRRLDLRVRRRVGRSSSGH